MDSLCLVELVTLGMVLFGWTLLEIKLVRQCKEASNG
jgi:hypothetical protein